MGAARVGGEARGIDAGVVVCRGVSCVSRHSRTAPSCESSRKLVIHQHARKVDAARPWCYHEGPLASWNREPIAESAPPARNAHHRRLAVPFALPYSEPDVPTAAPGPSRSSIASCSASAARALASASADGAVAVIATGF
jgi:hypothetical protein